MNARPLKCLRFAAFLLATVFCASKSHAQSTTGAHAVVNIVTADETVTQVPLDGFGVSHRLVSRQAQHNQPVRHGHEYSGLKKDARPIRMARDSTPSHINEDVSAHSAIELHNPPGQSYFSHIIRATLPSKQSTSNTAETVVVLE